MAMTFLDLSSSPEQSEDEDDVDIDLDIGLYQHNEQAQAKHTANVTSGKAIPTNGTSNSIANSNTRDVHVPNHPIPSMQGAFRESFLEASEESKPAPAIAKKSKRSTAAIRRQKLLDQGINEETHAVRWKPKSGQNYHELWKLIAQISFGMYLLLDGIARDEEQVLNILQVHVDEVDKFLEDTLADFNLAQNDIEERLKYLKLPLENITIFDSMLKDRSFRLQIVEGNEKIEHVITRTAMAMNDALKDVKEGLNSCKEFKVYLTAEQRKKNRAWKGKADMLTVFDAMKGNVDGWYKAYLLLQTKGKQLGAALAQLGSIVAEMDRRAGEVSRKMRFSSVSSATPPASSPPSSPSQKPRMSGQMRKSMIKDLRGTSPAFKRVPDRIHSPDARSKARGDDSSSFNLDESEPGFLLQPHTYSPISSPLPRAEAEPHESVSTPKSPLTSKLKSAQISRPESPATRPARRRRESLRQCFSISRKHTASPAIAPSPALSDTERWGSRHSIKTLSTITVTPHEHNSIPEKPPSRGLDSAYCSDFEKSSQHTQTLKETTLAYHDMIAQTVTKTRYSRNRLQVSTPENFSSHTEQQQNFIPGNASLNSLQRPWTAGRFNPLHMHPNGSNSNFSTNSHRTGTTTYRYTPSTLRKVPSAMGMSIESEMTDGTNGGRHTGARKKRSVFGWIKNAFSLSDEERVAFEKTKRVATENKPEARERKWIDGRRVDERGRPMSRKSVNRK